MKNQLVAVIIKELRQILRDRRILGMLLAAPIIQLIMLGYAVNFDVEHIGTLLCDQDRSEQSRDFSRELFSNPTFVPVSLSDNCLHPNDAIRTGDAEIALIIPSDYGKNIRRGDPVRIQLLADGSNPTIGRYARTAVEAFTRTISARLAAERAAETGIPPVGMPSPPEALVLFNPEMKSTLFMVPGIAAMILIVITLIAPALVLTKEKEMGILDQVYVTPLPVPFLVIGKLIPFIMFGLFNVMLILTVSIVVFSIPVRGHLGVYLLGTVLYLLSTLGLSLLIAAVSKTQQQAFLTVMLVLMPLLLLSGVMTPVSSMPPLLQPVSWVSPIRFYTDVLRGVLLKGSTLHDLRVALGMLLLLGSTYLGTALWALRKSS